MRTFDEWNEDEWNDGDGDEYISPGSSESYHARRAWNAALDEVLQLLPLAANGSSTMVDLIVLISTEIDMVRE